jgi:hypothetical protein
MILVHNLSFYVFKIYFNIILSSTSGSSKRFPSFSCSFQNVLLICLISHEWCAERRCHLPNFTIVIIIGKKKKYVNLHYAVFSSLLLLLPVSSRALFSNALNLYLFLNLKKQVSYPYKTRDKIAILCILVLKILDSRWLWIVTMFAMHPQSSWVVQLLCQRNKLVVIFEILLGLFLFLCVFELVWFERNCLLCYFEFFTLQRQMYKNLCSPCQLCICGESEGIVWDWHAGFIVFFTTTNSLRDNSLQRILRVLKHLEIYLDIKSTLSSMILTKNLVVCRIIGFFLSRILRYIILIINYDFLCFILLWSIEENCF